MILGSALCAGAPVSNFAMLLAGRGLQGVGSAGHVILIKVILADKVSLKLNALNNTIFTLVTGAAYCIGPTTGGYLTAVSWRWCFIINIPLTLAGLVLAHFVMRSVLLGPQDVPRGEDVGCISSSSKLINRLSTVDFGGQILFLFGMGLLVLALTWAGAYYPWANAKIISPLVTGSVLMLSFLYWEYLLLSGRRVASRYPQQQAMIPLKLLCSRNASVLMYINFITGMGMLLFCETCWQGSTSLTCHESNTRYTTSSLSTSPSSSSLILGRRALVSYSSYRVSQASSYNTEQDLSSC